MTSLLLLLLAAPAADAKADLLLRNAVVYTLDPARPKAEAIAIAAGRVLGVGSEAEVEPHRGPATRVLDLAGATLVPGFVEGHGHLLGLGELRTSVDLRDAATWDEVVCRVAAAAAQRPAGEWVFGRGWHESKWAAPPRPVVRGFPTHAALTAATPRNPVVLERADGHALIVNARVLEAMQIGRGTAVPEGGEIVRDAAGAVTGVLVDNAMALVKPPAVSSEERRRQLGLALEECLRKGVTGFHDAGVPLADISLYRGEAAAGRLPLRLYVMAAGLATMKALGAPESGLGGGMLTIRAVKLMGDGAMGSRGAALLEPYLDDAGNSGFFTTPPEEVLEAARYGLAHGFQVNVHAIGDRTNRMVLDQFERAFAERPQARDPRFRVEHAQILDERDIPRFARLGVIASMQGIHCTSDRPWAASRIGEARVAEGLYVWQKLLRSGARILNGTDVPVEDVDPVKNFHASVTREKEDGTPEDGFDPSQRMSREETLRSMTLEPAYGSFLEREQGSIERGKRADFTVLSRDIMTVPEDQILGAEVLYTIVDGRVRYQRP
jgi:hypothetical protein